MDVQTRCMLVTDLVGSTEVASRVGDRRNDELRSMCTEIQRVAVNEVGGVVVKTLGDGLLAAFPSAVASVDAAVAIQQRVERLRRHERDLPPVRVGCAAGDVVVEADDVNGVPVIIASRVCAAASGGEILVTDLVRALCGSRSAQQFEAAGSRDLKGLPEPVSVARVQWSVEADDELPAALVGIERSPFVGRDNELAALAEVWSAVVAGTRQVALLAGEPGIGKTRLAAEASRSAQASGAIVLFGRCDEELVAPFRPIFDAVKPLLERLPPASASRLTAVASEGQFAEDRVVEVIEALDEAIVAVGEPVVLVIDDLHWADRETLTTLRSLARARNGGRLLVIGTYRDTDVARRTALGATLADLRRERVVRRIAVEPLAPQSVRQMAENLAGSEFGPETLERLANATDGNPFFLEEVVAHLLDDVSDGSARIGEDFLPESIRDVIGRRLSQLPVECGPVLAIAAVAGREFDVDVLGACDSFEEAVVLDAVDAALEARLVQPLDLMRRFRFTHALVRQTLLEEVSSPRRALYHRSLGEAYAQRRPLHVEEIAHHRLEGAPGGDPPLARAAAVAGLSAADRALDDGGLDAALAWLDRVAALVELTGLDDDEVAFGRADCELRCATVRADQATVFTAAVRAAAIARRQGRTDRLVDVAIVANRVVVSDATTGPHVSLAREALEHLAPGDHRHAHLEVVVAAYEGRSDPTLLKDAVARATDIAESLSPDMAFGLVTTANLLGIGLPPWGLRERLFRIIDNHSDVATSSWMRRVRLQTLSVWWLTTGDRDRFDAVSAEYEELGRTHDLWLVKVFGNARNAAVAVAEGRFADARALVEVNRELVAARPHWRTGIDVLLLTLGCERDRFVRLLPTLKDLVDGGTPFLALPSVLAGVLAAHGDTDEAQHRLDVATSQPIPTDWSRPQALRWLAEAAIRLGDGPAAQRLVPHLDPYAGAFLVGYGGYTLECAADRSLGQLHATLGDHERAATHFHRALELELDFGATSLAGRTHRWAAANALASGDLRTAQAHALEALSTATRLDQPMLAAEATELIQRADA